MFQSYSPTTRWDDLGQPGDMAEIHDISIPAQSHQRLRAPSQEQLTKTGPDTSQPRSPAQRTRTPPRKEPHRPGAQGCNAEDDNDPELPKEVERLQTALSNFLHRLKKNSQRKELKRIQRETPTKLQHDWKGEDTHHKLPPTNIDFSPAVSNRCTPDTDTQQDRPRRACATTTGSERVFCGTYNEPVTEEDASFKKLSLQKPVSHHSSLGPTPCPLNEA
ncbi:hypothetical protein F2P79_025495 [Pimephales promelas]|nr:hypothetical protein F2P79_025495 [Pimephales promelas]